MDSLLAQRTQPVLACPPIQYVAVDAHRWSAVAESVSAGAGRLLALWGVATPGRPPKVSAAYALATGAAWVELELHEPHLGYPDLARIFPFAGRMQRAVSDLCGIAARNADDSRPWLDHGLWAGASPPLGSGVPDDAGERGPAVEYGFVQVQGEGVHEIAVGPVHAGIIEPGHFRFSVVGEKVLRLEERLGYAHKGIERRFTELEPLAAHRLAARVSGDTTVGFGWAYCMALEAACGAAVPERAEWLRALMLERERVANHLGDLGALGNDAGFGFGAAQFTRLRENWLRNSSRAFGHRLMMDCIIPGGVAGDVDAGVLSEIRQECASLIKEVVRLRKIYDEHAGLQDRFMGAGRVSPELAGRLGLIGLAARASGSSLDLRNDHPWGAYGALGVRPAQHVEGDVAARVSLRFDELLESLRLITDICERLPTGAVQQELAVPDGDARGAGWVEAWRGEVFVALELGAGRKITRCHCHDPSWQNWPVLEHAIMDNIVPDFPLINKSFNLSYSGHDL